MVTMMGGEKDDEVLSMSLEDMCPLNYAVQEIGMSNLDCILP